MTISTQKATDQNSLAMRIAGEVLAKGSDAERLFLEERSDLRLVMGSGGQRHLLETRSRGAAVEGVDSIHVTDPNVDELVALARQPVPKPIRAPERRRGGESPQILWSFDRDWIAARESALVNRIERAVGNIPAARWSMALIAFHQRIWVASRSEPATGDERRGCRLELKVWLDRYPKTMVVIDRVIGEAPPELPAALLDSVLERVLEKRATIQPKSLGTTSAVLAPGAGGVVIHELVGHALEADVSLGHPTWLQGVGVRPTRALDVIDDPRQGRGAWRIDDEGVSARPIVLVEGGHAAGLLLNRATATALGRSSTGHGRRSTYLTPTRPRMGCTWVAPGRDEPDEVVRDTNTGVFIRRMTAGRTEPAVGRASFLVTEADEIVRGRVERPLEPFIVELQGFEAWRSIDRICSDLEFDTCAGSCVRDGQPLAVSVGAPTMRIGVIRVVS